MLNLNTKLAELEHNQKKINMGIIGAGQMGKGMINQMFRMKGVSPIIVCDIDVEKAKNAYITSGIKEEDIEVTNVVSKASNALDIGKYVVTEDFEVVTKLSQVDVVIEGTGVPEVGTKTAIKSIYNGKHIVMLNVETDVTVGHILKKMADAAGVIYTVSAGDEPGAIKELYDFADAMGFEVIVAGKGKNNPLNREANPDTVRKEAHMKKMNPKMLASFVDGTKTMVEMTAVSNAIGFLPSKRGLNGPKSTVKELPKLLSLKEQGGILDKYNVVEYVNGIAPGVFVIVTTDSSVVRDEMAYLSMGEGPNYVLFRPYHLTSLETPLSAARAYIYKEPTIAPKGKPMSETVAVAKKDLKSGEYLDGIGGYTVYGVIDTVENARRENALPIGLVSNKTLLKKDVPKGKTITYDDVKLEKDSLTVQLRKLQDMLIYS